MNAKKIIFYQVTRKYVLKVRINFIHQYDFNFDILNLGSLILYFFILEAEGLDFPCIENRQCLTFLPNTTCQNNQCSCISGYHYVQNACYEMIGKTKLFFRFEKILIKN